MTSHLFIGFRGECVRCGVTLGSVGSLDGRCDVSDFTGRRLFPTGQGFFPTGRGSFPSGSDEPICNLYDTAEAGIKSPFVPDKEPVTMDAKRFDEILTLRFEKIRQVLGVKAGEYAIGGDRLYNFKRGAAVLGITPPETCLAYMTKHFVSVQDLVKAKAEGKYVKQEVVDEKLGDLVNYLLLLEATLLEGQ